MSSSMYLGSIYTHKNITILKILIGIEQSNYRAMNRKRADTPGRQGYIEKLQQFSQTAMISLLADSYTDLQKTAAQCGHAAGD